MVTVHLPAQFSSLASGQTRLSVSASTIREVFNEIDGIAPMLRSQVFDSAGALRRFVALFLDDAQILDGDCDTSVFPGSEMTIVMAVAGG